MKYLVMLILSLLQMTVGIIWLIDILNIDFIVNGIHVAKYLDEVVPLNTLFWFLYFCMFSISAREVKEW